ncbi:phosphotransferase system, HPr-related protein [Pseudomonas aeruginosa]
MATRRKTTPQEIDDIQDRMGSMRELDFDERRQARKARIGDERPEAEVEAEFSSRRVREAGHAGGQPDEDDGYQDNVGMDDLAPETLIDESGDRSPAERGGESPADKRLRVVHGNEIGAGHGLDEAELARRDPLDGSSDEER